MLLSEDKNYSLFYIQSYSDDGIQVNDNTYQSSLIITPERIIGHWPPRSVTELTPQYWQAVLALTPSIILLGTGKQQVFPESPVLKCIYAAGLGLEVMSTSAACRTFNVLNSEGRNVVAALLL